jgi:peptide-methionine (R)-S-oxide reductase
MQEPDAMYTRRQFNIAGLGFALGSIAASGARAEKEVFEIMKTDEEWKKILTKEQFYVLRQHGTERAGSSPLDKTYADGTYHCAACDLPVYSSEAKFDSGTGWPSFYQPLDNAIGTSTHLGHVFDDGPKPTGKRYCMNGVAMKFVPKAAS